MAPVLAEKARGLSSSRRGDDEVFAEPVPEAVSMIEMRVHWLERRAEMLDEQVASASELVKGLTDQHAELVRAVDVLIVRTRVLSGACIALGAGLVLLAFLR